MAIMLQWFDHPQRYRVIIIGLLLAGLVLRIAWLIGGHHSGPLVAEMYEIARVSRGPG